MNAENNNQLANNQGENVLPLSRSGGEKVTQPSEGIKQEIQAQQAQPQTVQPTMLVPQDPLTNPVSNPASTYQHAPPGQMQASMSASQMGYNQPKKKLFNLEPKQLIIKGVFALVILGGVIAILVMTNIVALSEFKNVGYENSQGTRYKLDFYTKHGSNQLKSGNKQLISKVSKDDKFPITLSISTTNEMTGYNRVKDCIGFTKVFDVQNNNHDQKVSICDFGKQGNVPAKGVYIAGLIHNNKAHIITISQNYDDIDLSSQSSAQQSLTKFGMEPYNSDIERIVSSIKIE